MTLPRILGLTLVLVMLCAAAGMGETKISVTISGPGVVRENTIKVGEPVSIDVYWENEDDDRRGFTTGFKMTSKDIKNIVHVPDTAKGLTEEGDIKAHNGWDGYLAWDYSGLRVVRSEGDWDGVLPDLVGFGGLRVKNVYNAHENKKVLSWTIIVNEPGRLTVDSSFYDPAGIWAIVGPDSEEIRPTWGGPYTFLVIE
jgi:hypothetical protein